MKKRSLQISYSEIMKVEFDRPDEGKKTVCAAQDTEDYNTGRRNERKFF